jgi:hypothetical protein
MKKLFLIAGIALMGLTANAQDGLKGTWWAGGQLAFGSNEINTLSGDKESKTNILPIVGVFITPSVTVGAGVGVLNEKHEDLVSGATTLETSTIVFKPLVRKYWNIKGGLFFYGQAAVPVLLTDDKQSDAKATTIALTVAPGFDYVVNKWLTVETSFDIFSVGSTTADPGVGDSSSDFNFNFQPMNTVSDRTLGGLTLGVKFLF